MVAASLPSARRPHAARPVSHDRPDRQLPKPIRRCDRPSAGFTYTTAVTVLGLMSFVAAPWRLVVRSSVMFNTACLRPSGSWFAKGVAAGRWRTAAALLGIVWGQAVIPSAPQSSCARLPVRSRRGGLAPLDALRSPRDEKGLIDGPAMATAGRHIGRPQKKRRGYNAKRFPSGRHPGQHRHCVRGNLGGELKGAELG